MTICYSSWSENGFIQGLTNVGLGAHGSYNQDEAATVYGQLFTPDEGQKEKTAIIPSSEQ